MFSSEPQNEAATGSGLRISGDKATMGALQDALHSVEVADNPDLTEWCEQAWKALAKGVQSGTATLPAFAETPALDSFNDDQGPGPDSEEY